MDTLIKQNNTKNVYVVTGTLVNTTTVIKNDNNNNNIDTIQEVWF